LQSPTGTGKTLSLLCGALAWLQRYRQEAYTKNKDPKNDVAPIVRIIYSSRTHSQLTQVVKELKNTVYRPKICYMGSKD
jgi:regulator of telomere elongation helicase 1